MITNHINRFELRTTRVFFYSDLLNRDVRQPVTRTFQKRWVSLRRTNLDLNIRTERFVIMGMFWHTRSTQPTRNYRSPCLVG